MGCKKSRMQCFLRTEAEIVLGSETFVAEDVVDRVEKMEGGRTR